MSTILSWERLENIKYKIASSRKRRQDLFVKVQKNDLFLKIDDVITSVAFFLRPICRRHLNENDVTNKFLKKVVVCDLRVRKNSMNWSIQRHQLQGKTLYVFPSKNVLPQPDSNQYYQLNLWNNQKYYNLVQVRSDIT